eukprot:SAG31_NODE_4629_length_3085_cov_2.778299_4_plen_300_part_00
MLQKRRVTIDGALGSMTRIHRTPEDSKRTQPIDVYTRWFGGFPERTLMTNTAGKQLISMVCTLGGFTDGWTFVGDSGSEGDSEVWTMFKVPVAPLKDLMMHTDESTAAKMVGAYNITAAGYASTEMNILMPRQLPGFEGSEGAFNKFTLFYPPEYQPTDNGFRDRQTAVQWDSYDLHKGLSLRTGVFAGMGLDENHASLTRAYSGRIKGLQMVYGGHSVYFPSTATANATAEETIRMFERDISLLEAHDKNAPEEETVLKMSYKKHGDQTAARDELDLVKLALFSDSLKQLNENCSEET